MAKNNLNGQNASRPNIWGMIWDIGVSSLNKGQFPIDIVGTVIIILVLKMTPQDSSKLVFEILNLFKNYYLIGWGTGGVVIMGWYFNSKHLRRIHSEEMTRVTEEKKELQQMLTNKKLPSSNK